MPYRYLDDRALADVAFEATGVTLETTFAAAVDATINTMVTDITSVVARERRSIHLRDEAADLLLFQLLQEIIYYKDAESLLLRVPEMHIERREHELVLDAEGVGERIDPARHELIVDVKAVTLHRFEVVEGDDGWEARVILDV